MGSLSRWADDQRNKNKTTEFKGEDGTTYKVTTGVDKSRAQVERELSGQDNATDYKVNLDTGSIEDLGRKTLKHNQVQMNYKKKESRLTAEQQEEFQKRNPFVPEVNEPEQIEKIPQDEALAQAKAEAEAAFKSNIDALNKEVESLKAMSNEEKLVSSIRSQHPAWDDDDVKWFIEDMAEYGAGEGEKTPEQYLADFDSILEKQQSEQMAKFKADFNKSVQPKQSAQTSSNDDIMSKLIDESLSQASAAKSTSNEPKQAQNGSNINMSQEDFQKMVAEEVRRQTNPTWKATDGGVKLDKDTYDASKMVIPENAKKRTTSGKKMFDTIQEINKENAKRDEVTRQTMADQRAMEANARSGSSFDWSKVKSVKKTS